MEIRIRLRCTSWDPPKTPQSFFTHRNGNHRQTTTVAINPHKSHVCKYSSLLNLISKTPRTNDPSYIPPHSNDRPFSILNCPDSHCIDNSLNMHIVLPFLTKPRRNAPPPHASSDLHSQVPSTFRFVCPTHFHFPYPCLLTHYAGVHIQGRIGRGGLRDREKGMGQPTRVNGSQAACLRGSSQADPCSGRPMKISSPETGDNTMGRIRRRRKERERRMTQGQSAHCPCHSISPPPTPTHTHKDLHAPKLPPRNLSTLLPQG